MSIARYCGYFSGMSTKIFKKYLALLDAFVILRLCETHLPATDCDLSLWRTLPHMRSDPIELEVFKHLFHSIAEEMGASLRRTAFSPNIKERRDYSCALFDGSGQVLAMGDHMPVHLGSMPMSVRAAIADLTFAPGDIAMLNDPFPRRHASARHHGGGAGLHRRRRACTSRHLAGASLQSQPAVRRLPVHCPAFRAARTFLLRARHSAAPDFFVAARAHHADVGGTYAGSMGPCREIYQEGFRIPPVKIVRGGQIDRDLLALLLNNVRTPEEREGDLRAQLAACHTGTTRLHELCGRYGLGASAARWPRTARLLRADDARLPRNRSSRYLRCRGLSRRRWCQRRSRAYRCVHQVPSKVVRGATGSRGFHRQLAAGSRQHQRGGSHHLFRLLLRFPLPVARRCSRHRRPHASHSTHRARRYRRQCAAPGCRCRRQCRDFAAHRRRASPRPGSGTSRRYPRSFVWHHEQSHHRWHGHRNGTACALRLLRDHRWRFGSQLRPTMAFPACTLT